MDKIRKTTERQAISLTEERRRPATKTDCGACGAVDESCREGMKFEQTPYSQVIEFQPLHKNRNGSKHLLHHKSQKPCQGTSVNF